MFDITFQACVIFGAVSIFAVLSWWFIPADKWLSTDHVQQMEDSADAQTVAST